jgi:hypothetical protein
MGREQVLDHGQLQLVKLQRFLVDTWTRLVLGFEMFSGRSAL